MSTQSLTTKISDIPGIYEPQAGPPSATTTAMPEVRTPGDRVSDSGLVQPTPYYVQASCELSEDYFLTDAVIIQDGDKIMPFSVVDPFTGAACVEALVLSSGKLSHLYPDPATVSGWSFTPVTTPFDAVSDAAVVGGEFGAQLMVIGPPSFATPAAWLTRVGPGAWSGGATGTVPLAFEQLSAGVSQYGPYFYGWVHGQADGDDQFSLVLYGARKTGSDTTGTQMLTLQWPTRMGLTIENTVVLYDPDQVPDGTATGFAVVLTSDGQISTYNQAGPLSFSGQPSALPTAAAALLWAYSTPGSTTGQPAILWQNDNGIVGFQEETGTWNFTGFTYGNPAGDGQVAAWRLNGAYTFTFLDNGLAQVVSETPEAGTGLSWTAPIPLTGGFEKIYSLPTDPTQATLFAVDVDQTLNVLTKDPALGWTQAPVHQKSTTLTEVTSWRVQASVLDSNNVGVAGGQLRISTDRPVGLWQTGGSTVVTPAAPVTMTADGLGRVTFSIPATELDIAGLTAQALDSTGAPTGAAFAVTPDIDVHRFLAGGSSLTDIGKLSGTALLAAKNGDGSPLLPALANLPGSQQASGAAAVAGAFNHTATLGFGFQPQKATDTQSALFDLTGSVPGFQTSTNPDAFSQLTAPEGLESWWDSVKHDAESAFHGLRHGVITFKKMVTSWSADLGAWTINLIVDIGDGLDNALSYVVSDMKSAIHAISAFFHALGADLKAAWEWLKHHVLALLKEAEANAKVLEGWLDQATSQFTAVINSIETNTDKWFSAKEGAAHDAISKLAQDFEKATFGSSAPLPPPTTDSGSNDADLIFTDAGNVIKFVRHISGSWLWDKVMSHLPHDDAGPTLNPAMDQVRTDLVTTYGDLISVIEGLGNLFYATLKISSPANFNETTFADFFGELDNTVNQGLELLDQISDTLLDALKDAVASLDDLLNYQFQMVPVLGDLLELAGIDTTLSVKHLISLIVAYPATLIHDLAVGGPAFPTSASQNQDLGSGDADPWAAGLGFFAALTQIIWGFNDAWLDITSNQKNSDGSDYTAPVFTTYVDIVCPILLTILQWPGAPGPNGKTAKPFSTGFADGTDAALVPFMVWTSLLTPFAGILQVAWNKTSDADPKSLANKYFQPFIQMACGISNTVLSSFYAWDNHSSGATKASGILGNLSYDLAVVGTKWMAESTDDASIIVKTLIDAAGNLGAGICMFDDACTAAGL